MKTKKKIARKKAEVRCACCELRRDDRERKIEHIVFESLRRLALAMKNKNERESLLALLEKGLDRLLEIDEGSGNVDRGRV